MLGLGRAGLEDEALAAVQAMRISVSICIVLDEAGPVVLVLGHLRGQKNKVQDKVPACTTRENPGGRLR